MLQPHERTRKCTNLTLLLLLSSLGHRKIICVDRAVYIACLYITDLTTLNVCICMLCLKRPDNESFRLVTHLKGNPNKQLFLNRYVIFTRLKGRVMSCLWPSVRLSSVRELFQPLERVYLYFAEMCTILKLIMCARRALVSVGSGQCQGHSKRPHFVST